MRTVKQVAALAGVTVRTLHHYDELGLLRPSERTGAGYRLYTHEDLLRLQEILIWRQLGFALGDIRALMDDPHHDRAGALRRQRALVAEEAERLAATARAIDDALAALADGRPLQEDAMFNPYEKEAEERWGHTDAYRESTRRARGYGEAEWSAIQAEIDAIETDFAALLAAGADPRGAEARAVAERHRAQISRWFYDCPPTFHRGIAEMYIADPRFTAHYDERAEGLARFVHDAIQANADAQEAAVDA